MNEAQREIYWILRAQVGDRSAYNQLLKHHQGRLFSYLLGLVNDHHTAEDLLQEIFVIVYKKLRWLEEPKLFRGWLRRIATRAAFRKLKKLRRYKEISIDQTQESDLSEFSRSLSDPILQKRLPTLMENVSPASRAVLLLHYWEGWSLKEISGILSIELGTVKSRLHYGLKSLRKQLHHSKKKES